MADLGFAAVNATYPVSDIEFLENMEVQSKDFLYVYRTGSALLRRDVRAKVKRLAEAHGQMLAGILTIPGPRGQLVPKLYEALAAASVFGEGLIICDLEMEKLGNEDLQTALLGLANREYRHHLCLLVPENHAVRKTAAWQAAVQQVGLIEEQLVTITNYRAIARYYFERSRLGNHGYLSRNERFFEKLKKFVREKSRTPFELSMQIDLIVLSDMEQGKFRDADETITTSKERRVLPERLRRFLDYRDASSFSELMVMIDWQRQGHMLEPTEIVTRIYRATAGTLESHDKRYRRPEEAVHLIWGVLLLANEQAFLKGNVFVAMEQVCQEYFRAAKDPKWFGVTDQWQSMACLLEFKEVEDLSRLDSARFKLRRALRKRIDALNEPGLAWFQASVSRVESESPVEVKVVAPAYLIEAE